MITLTTEQARQIEEALDKADSVYEANEIHQIAVQQVQKALATIRAARAKADHIAASGNKVPDHIADAGKLVEQTKATKQRTCECVVSRIIFSGDREYCETCGWPIYTFNEHRARLLEEQNV